MNEKNIEESQEEIHENETMNIGSSTSNEEL
jgi:hypothetical protein